MSTIVLGSDPNINYYFDILRRNAEYFLNTTWLDNSGNLITEAIFGDDVTFKVETKDIPDGTVLNFELYDKDAVFDDSLNQTFSANVTSNFAEFTFTLDDKWLKDSGEEFDKAIEIYFKVTCKFNRKNIELNLPKNQDDYLMIYEDEVLITVIVELPHSEETGWGKLGLAGHTAMAIDNQFYDFGPNNGVGSTLTVDERIYHADFNDDGDQNDVVTFNPGEANFKFSPGIAWWGNHISILKGVRPQDVTLPMALHHISLHWQRDGTYIYGSVYKAEFYVKKSQAAKMKDWWENRYDHLGVYSVFPWSGQQCTTTVKKALRNGDIPIPIGTLRPHGILWDLRNIVKSTSFKKNKQPAIVTKIKSESHDWIP